MTKLFTVETSNKYMLTISKIEKIEDAGDDFVTEDELNEMLGGDTYYGSGVTYRKQLIVDELEMWKAKIVERNTKTIVITDQELIECLTDSARSVSDYVKGLRRVGNRLFLHEKDAKTVATKKDHSRLINMATSAINKANRNDKGHSTCMFELKYCNTNYEGSLRLIQKLVKWEDLVFDDKYYNFTEHDIEMMKQVWDTPTMFNK